MCELKVQIGAAQENRPVAQDIIHAFVKPDHVLLKDVLGATHTIPEALISTVDIGKELLLLRQSPIVPSFLRFLEALESVEINHDYALAEEEWNGLKAKGDELVRSLWRKYGRSS